MVEFRGLGMTKSIVLIKLMEGVQRNKPYSPTELSKEMNINQKNMSHIITDFLEKKWITVDTTVNDRRIVKIGLTRLGVARAKLAKIDEHLYPGRFEELDDIAAKAIDTALSTIENLLGKKVKK